MNEPLALEQLREMNGLPVWGMSLVNDKPGEWFIVRIVEMSKTWFIACAGAEQGFGDKDNYGKTWLAYAYPPAHIDRKAWEPCEMCGGKKTLYQHTTHTNLYMNTFGEAATLVTECIACPPYANCCMKDISANSVFKINFCPNCGRPLTEEAWEELEKRVSGENE